MNFPLPRTALVAFVLCLTLLSALPCQAVLLVYEGYNGYSGSLGSVATPNPNANTVGLDTATAYQGASVTNYAVNASSLTFGSNFATSGGSVTVPASTAVAAARISLSSSFSGGVLYSSYLIRINSRTTGTNDGGGTRLSNDITNGTERFLSYADSRTSSSSTAIGYDSTVATAPSGAVLSTSTTYLVVSRYTGVGTPSSGTGTLYVFTQAQYDAFFALGVNDTNLDNLSVALGELTAKSTDTGSTANGFATGNYVHLVNQGNSSTFDELRYASTLGEALGIPEPGAGALALLGVALLFRRRR